MKIFALLLSLLLLPACAQVGDHRKALSDSGEQKLTLGVAQKEIKVGMSQADVAKALGSPNMVTKDSEVPIVGSDSSGELPNSFDRCELRAVRWQEQHS